MPRIFRRLPREILLMIIRSVDNTTDLLAFALTCRFIYEIIVPDHLLYFRILNQLGIIDICKSLSQNPHLCNNTQELVWDQLHATLGTAPDPPVLIRRMVNLRRLKVGEWRQTDFKVARDILGALVDSKCGLEEFDFFLLPSLLREVNFTRMLSNSPVLILLNLTVLGTITSRADLFRFTCPNLENLTISIVGRFSTNTSQDLSTVIEFFKRHPKLTTLSLSSNVYAPTSSPYITPDSLPRLESLAYVAPVRVPLSHILSPASARKLRHLTISDGDASLENSDLSVYRELTSLETCCITSGNCVPTNYENINGILANFVAHVTNVQKIYLPLDGCEYQGSLFFKTLYILQCLPKLTHLSGISLPAPDVVLQELYHFCRLKYIITPAIQSPVFQLTRNHKTKRMSVDDRPLAGKNLDCDAATWGNFYRGMGGLEMERIYAI